jgi:hypothetical protein
MADKTPRKIRPKGKKKPWQSPRLKSGQLFEANSLACFKNDSSEQCGQGATAS